MQPLSRTDKNPAALLALSAVSRQFRLGQTTVHALRAVDLRIARGELVAIWGPSGSGKSTLLNILGLIDAPDSGQFSLNGEQLRNFGRNALADMRNRSIGFIYQSFNLVPVLSALENTMLPLEIGGVPGKQAKAIAAQWLARVGLEKFSAFRPDRLSGGQRQRVAIARALVMQPALVIADEPTANLDSENSATIIALLEALNRDTGVTCVFSTHDPRLLKRIPRQILLRDGAIEQDKTSDCAVTQ